MSFYFVCQKLFVKFQYTLFEVFTDTEEKFTNTVADFLVDSESDMLDSQTKFGRVTFVVASFSMR